MDRNGTVEKRLNQDLLNQVNRTSDKRKERYNRSTDSTGHKIFAGARPHAEHKHQWAKSHTLSDGNGRRGNYAQKPVQGTTQEFRVVRDNRINNNIPMEIMPGLLQDSAKNNHQMTSNVIEKSSSGSLIDHNHSPSRNTDGLSKGQTQNEQGDCGLGHGKNEKSSGNDPPSLPKEKQMTVSHSIRTLSRDVKNSVPFASVTSVNGVYSSSSDPIHVPSSRTVGTMGAIQRAVGVVGVQRQSSDQSSTSNTHLNNSYSIPSLERDSFFSRRTTTLRNNVEPSNSSIYVSRSFSASQYHAKSPQQVVGHNKASQVSKEWKPKSNQKPNADSPGSNTHSSQVKPSVLSEKPVQAATLKNEHVIIPQHLRVPESERSEIRFGSFGTGFDSLKASKNSKEANNEISSSVSTSFAAGFDKDADDHQLGPVDSLVRTRSSHTVSPSETKHPLPINDETFSPRDIESYPDIELIQSHNPSFSSAEPQQQQNPPSLPDYSGYDPQMRFIAPITKMMVENDNIRGQGLSSGHEGLNSHATNDKPLSSVPLVQQQQQPLTQLFSQVPISHLPSFVPYRQVFSPLYIPQMVMPNYSNSSGHSHPSSGNNYLIMPGGAPQLNSNSMKYGASQYKPVRSGSPTAAYGSYINQGYAVGVTGSSTGLEGMASINYKDNNIYNPQLEGDVWIQQRDVTTLQSTPYYNLSGQAAAVPPTPHPAYLPGAHTANPSIYPAAYQPSHMQYPGVYHPSQPGSFPGHTNHVIQQQQVPSGLAGNPAIGMGGYQQQPQVGNHGWSF